MLQPMRVVSFDVNKQQVLLHEFDWASEIDSTAPSNELIESNREAVLTADQVIRTCEVRQFLTR